MDFINAQRDIFLSYLRHGHRDAAHRPSSVFEHDGDGHVHGRTIRVAALNFSRIYEDRVGHGSDRGHAVEQAFDCLCTGLDGGSRSLAHATTRAEAFWRWPILDGSNMPVKARGGGGRRTIGLSAAAPWLLLSRLLLFCDKAARIALHLPAARSSWRDN